MEDLKDSTNASAHTVEETRNSLSEYDAMITTEEGLRWYRSTTARGMKEQETKKLEILSKHPNIHVLCDFSSLGATPYHDTYSVFSVDPMYVFHLAVSQLLKDTSKGRLFYNFKKTDHYKYTRGSMSAFDSLHKRIIREVNKFIMRSPLNQMVQN